jgi:hypothetical protein
LLNILGIEPIEVKQPKIRVVHLLMDPNSPEDIPLEKWSSTVSKQNSSIFCWENMKHKFFDYVPRYSVVNRTELPYENCKDPGIINPSKDLINNPPTLSYGHYGAYKAHTQGILENFTDDIDALIIAEGDSFTNLTPDEFYRQANQFLTYGRNNSCRFFVRAFDDTSTNKIYFQKMDKNLQMIFYRKPMW